ncbi:FGGY-family carbohydrate kinase [Trichothermofontia sp.]
MGVHPKAAGTPNVPDSLAYGLGIDFGTSGARAVVIDRDRRIHCNVQVSFTALPTDQALLCATDLSLCLSWQSALIQLLQAIPIAIRQRIGTIAINGTSSTVLLCNAAGQPITDPLLYNDARGADVLDRVRAIAPPEHVVISATSSLSKLLWWQAQGITATATPKQPLYLLHQADWLAFLLHDRLGISDTHNALKLGYDVVNACYPDWVLQATAPVHLPAVVAPGTVIGPVRSDHAERWQLPPTCQICAGTTDSIAAFLASGATTPGEAVTSLGSTLVLKLLSETRIEVASYGIYSHRLGNHWLVGGASNTGGAVLKHFFSEAELVALSAQINPQQVSPLHYYPLLQSGERFPINDPALAPQLEPRPTSPIAFLHGLLESMARIEAEGYALLTAYGAPPLQRVYTAGGGAQNPTWTALRQRYLGVPVLPAAQTEAAYGTALLGLGFV